MIEVLHRINYMSGKHARTQCDSRYGLARFMTQYNTFMHSNVSIFMYYLT